MRVIIALLAAYPLAAWPIADVQQSRQLLANTDQATVTSPQVDLSSILPPIWESPFFYLLHNESQHQFTYMDSAPFEFSDYDASVNMATSPSTGFLFGSDIGQGSDNISQRFFWYHEGRLRFSNVVMAEPACPSYVSSTEAALPTLQALRRQGYCEEADAMALACAWLEIVNDDSDLTAYLTLDVCENSCVHVRSCTDPSATTPTELWTRKMLAISNLRRGNWLTCEDPTSCILPLPSSTSQLDAAYADAIEYFCPSSLPTCSQYGEWFVNLILMRTGNYPQGAPSNVETLPPQLFNTDEAHKFLALSLGSDAATLGGQGSTIADWLGPMSDDDWHGMLHLGHVSVDSNAFMLHHTNGSYAHIDIGPETKAGNIIKAADYDNDGDLDLFIGRGNFGSARFVGNNSLLRNDGGVFTLVDVPVDSCAGGANGITAEWVDVDLDGYLDLFVGRENPNCELWHNQGDGTFVDRAAAFGVSHCGFAKGVAVGDVNNDGYPDLWIATLGGANLLYVNQGGSRFMDTALEANVGVYPTLAFPSVFMDINHDGHDDLLVGAHRPPDGGELFAHYMGAAWEEGPRMDKRLGEPDSGLSRLYLNLKDGTFRDVSEAYGLGPALGAMGMNVGDIDNDGYYDIYFGTGSPEFDRLTPSVMLRFDALEGHFEDVTIETGLGHLSNNHGIAFADVNNDGLQDIVASLGGPTTPLSHDALFLNPGDSRANAHNWIKVSLTGVKSNRLGHGARLQVVDCATGRSIHTRQGLGASFGANPVTVQHIGVGDAKLLNITVKWPHASFPVDTYAGLPVNKWVQLTEGAPAGARVKSLASWDRELLRGITSLDHVSGLPTIVA